MDIRDLDEHLDVMTVSSFFQNYYPKPGSVIHALDEAGISVEQLGSNPAMDLRSSANIWLSDEVTDATLPISRIGCLEMSPYTLEHDAGRAVKSRFFPPSRRTSICWKSHPSPE